MVRQPCVRKTDAVLDVINPSARYVEGVSRCRNVRDVPDDLRPAATRTAEAGPLNLHSHTSVSLSNAVDFVQCRLNAKTAPSTSRVAIMADQRFAPRQPSSQARSVSAP